ncbi:MAG: ATP-binding protein [Verrucomicrobiota bacterium]
MEDVPSPAEIDFHATFAAGQSELCDVLEQIDAATQKHSYPADVAYALKLSVEELAMNTIHYGCHKQKQDCKITVTLSRNETHALLRVEDNGQAFDPLETSEGEHEPGTIGGHGIFLVRQMMDSLEYLNQDQHNIVIARKQLPDASG